MIEIKYDTFWPRFWAGWIDSLVFLPLIVIDHFIWEGHAQLPIVVVASWYVLYFSSYYIYSILMHGKYGQTLGKMAMRVKVLDLSEKKLTMPQAIKRDIVPLFLVIISIVMNMPKILSGVNIYDPTVDFDLSFYITTYAEMTWFLAEIITMLFNDKRRALHDLIAGSVVVKWPQRSIAPDASGAAGIESN
jgi:uncharacterized RDD family membrane protein YckC